MYENSPKVFNSAMSLSDSKLDRKVAESPNPPKVKEIKEKQLKRSIYNQTSTVHKYNGTMSLYTACSEWAMDGPICICIRRYSSKKQLVRSPNNSHYNTISTTFGNLPVRVMKMFVVRRTCMTSVSVLNNRF